MAILAAAGDIGGQRALVPALKELLAAGGRVVAFDHRDLAGALPEAPRWRSGPLPEVKCMVFSTSVADAAPLQLARRCRAEGIRVECVLDNWANYRRRLELDGGPLLVPDAYHVMDALARDEAIREGLPPQVLVVSGHPGLAELSVPSAPERERLRRRLKESLGIPPECGLIVFVSEPAERDQAPGYTEKQVLALLCNELRAAGGKWGVCVLAHPREVLAEVERAWREGAAGIPGGVLRADEAAPSQAVAAADGVAGMTSILLYESWLLGQPTLSLQPGLSRADLRVYRSRAGVHCAENATEMPRIREWLAQAAHDQRSPRPELAAHHGAARRLAEAWMPYSM
jgi:hypothetical protein